MTTQIAETATYVKPLNCGNAHGTSIGFVKNEKMQGRAAQEALRKWLVDSLDGGRTNAKTLAALFRVHPAAITRIRQGKRRIQLREFLLMQPLLGPTPPYVIEALRDGTKPDANEQFAELMGNDTGGLLAQKLVSSFDPEEPDEEQETVPVVGYVGASGEAVFWPAGDLDYVPAPEGSTESTVAVEIRGTSLGALLNRWLVYYDDVRRPLTADLVGQLCVVGLKDGRILIKKVRRPESGKRGVFDLFSEVGDPLRDTTIDWGAKVKSMTPP